MSCPEFLEISFSLKIFRFGWIFQKSVCAPEIYQWRSRLWLNFPLGERFLNRQKRRNLVIITSMFVDVIQFAETLKDHMNAIVIADMFTLIFWVQSYRRKNVVTSMNVPKPFMNAILMPLATTMTEATLVHATADTKISMVMDEIAKISMSVLLKLTNAMR